MPKDPSPCSTSDCARYAVTGGRCRPCDTRHRRDIRRGGPPPAPAPHATAEDVVQLALSLGLPQTAGQLHHGWQVRLASRVGVSHTRIQQAMRGEITRATLEKWRVKATAPLSPAPPAPAAQ